MPPTVKPVGGRELRSKRIRILEATPDPSERILRLRDWSLRGVDAVAYENEFKLSGGEVGEAAGGVVASALRRASECPTR